VIIDVVVLPRAEEELNQSADWWSENRSPEQASRWWDGILQLIESLCENPLRFPIARENSKHPYELREMHFGLGAHPTHRVLFTTRPNQVVVVSVRHVAQDDFEPN
jgi:plasmid stabilization system protein ParE